MKTKATPVVLLLFTIRYLSGLVYNFRRVCLSVCQTITFERMGSSYLHIGYTSWEYGSSSYMKVIGSSQGQGQGHRSKNNVENPHSRNEELLSAISPFRLWRIEWCDRHLCHV